MVGHSAYLKITTTYGGVDYLLPAGISSVYYAPCIVFLRKMSGWVYGFHMPLFFCLSGAVLHLKPIGSFDRFCRKKVRRLLLPYFFAGMFFMLPVKYMGGFYTKEGLLSAVRGFWSGIDSGHLWFLSALFWCMVVFVALLKGLERAGCQSEYALLFISGIVQLNYSRLPFDVLGLKQGLSYIFWFACGYLFESVRKENLEAKARTTGESQGKEQALFLLGSFITFCLSRRYAILNTFFTIVFGCLSAYGIAKLCDSMLGRFSETGIYRIFARNLFYIYLFHDPLEYIVLRMFMNGNFLTTAAGCYVYVCSRIIGVIAVSVLLGEAVQRTLGGRRAV